MEPGDSFGIVDISWAIEQLINHETKDIESPDPGMLEQMLQYRLWQWDFTSIRLRRRFSIQVVEEQCAEYQYLSLPKLLKLRSEFPEVFSDIF